MAKGASGSIEVPSMEKSSFGEKGSRGLVPVVCRVQSPGRMMGKSCGTRIPLLSSVIRRWKKTSCGQRTVLVCWRKHSSRR